MARVNSGVFLSGSQLQAGAKIESFDQIRGFNPSMSTVSNLRSFCTNEGDLPRLQVLENYKQLNRMIRRNFMNDTDRRGLPHEDVRKLEEEDRSTQHMSQVLQKLQSRFTGRVSNHRRHSTLS